MLPLHARRWLAFGLLAACATPEATDGERERWRDAILPNESELAWQEIPWRMTFADGLRAADEAQKPLLLWLMNGHPLGCT